jgi:hypothetical protein
MVSKSTETSSPHDNDDDDGDDDALSPALRPRGQVVDFPPSDAPTSPDVMPDVTAEWPIVMSQIICHGKGRRVGVGLGRIKHSTVQLARHKTA